MTVLNFSFGFLDIINNKIETNPNAVTGNFTLGLFKVKSECYDELKISLTELNEALSLLQTITLDGKEYKIEYWLGGDLKFLALVLGMNKFDQHFFNRFNQHYFHLFGFIQI